jgi:hypothetical protein
MREIKLLTITALTFVLVGCGDRSQQNRTSFPLDPINLVITGPEGQRFTGTYVADGRTNSVAGIVPTVLTMQARDVIYEFKRHGGEGEFRVEASVDGRATTSFVEDGPGTPVRGWLRRSETGGSAGGL